MGTGVEVSIYGVGIKLIGVDIEGQHLNGGGEIETCVVFVNVKLNCEGGLLPEVDIDLPELRAPDVPGVPTPPSWTFSTGDPEVRDFNEAVVSSGALKDSDTIGYEKRRMYVNRTFTIGPVPLVVEAGAVARAGGSYAYAFPTGIYYMALRAPTAEAGLYALGGIGTSLLSGGVAVEGILGYIGFESVFSGELHDINNNALFDRYTELAFAIRLMRAKLGLYLKQSWWSLKWCKKKVWPGIKVYYPCGWRKKTNYYHKWLYKTPYVFNAVFPVFSDADRSAVLPTYGGVTPTAVQVGFGTVDFVFTGRDFNKNVHVDVVDDWCSNPQEIAVAYQDIRYKKIIRCTPVKSGTQQFRIYYDDGVVRGTPEQLLDVDVTPAPQFSSISITPTAILVGDAVTVTGNGNCMTGASSLSGLTNCTQPVLQSGGTATRREYRCQAQSPAVVTGTLA
ncbi:MAG: hypothetical protein D6800_02575, partial [Candidatus Zixiibacteriota bacterium]